MKIFKWLLHPSKQDNNNIDRRFLDCYWSKREIKIREAEECYKISYYLLRKSFDVPEEEYDKLDKCADEYRNKGDEICINANKLWAKNVRCVCGNNIISSCHTHYIIGIYCKLDMYREINTICINNIKLKFSSDYASVYRIKNTIDIKLKVNQNQMTCNLNKQQL